MARQPEHKNSVSRDVAGLSAEFILVCIVAFVAGVSVTFYFNGSMGDEMEMPGGLPALWPSLQVL